MKIEIKNLDKFKRFMEDKQEKLKNALPESVRDATLKVQNEVKTSIARGTNAPRAVDTGRFLNSVDFMTLGPNEAKVFTDLEYAKFLEYGTSKMDSRPHFGNTTKIIAPSIKEDFNVKIKKVVEK